MKEKHNGRWLRSMILIILCWTLTIVSVPCSAAGAGNADQKDGKLEVYFIDVGQPTVSKGLRRVILQTLPQRVNPLGRPIF